MITAPGVLHPAGEAPAVANLACQVGAVRGVGNAYPRRRLPSLVCWFTLEPVPRTGSSDRILPARVRGEAPVDLRRVLEVKNARELLRDLELATRLHELVVDHLGQDLHPPEPEDDLGAAGKNGVRHAERLWCEHLPARRALGISDRAA